MDYKKKEALWKQSISKSHQIWCSCPNYLLHFEKPSCHTGGDVGVVGEGVSPGEGISFVTETDGGEGSTGDPGEGQTPR